MTMRRKSVFLLTGALAVALAFGAFSFHNVAAQDPTPTPPADATAQPVSPEGDRANGRTRVFKGGVSDEDLADALGIEVEELQQAYQAATDQALDQAVDEGLLTQEQADAIRERAANGGQFHFGWRKMGGSEIDYDALLANALGITEERLQEARLEAYNANLDQAVEDGTLTQEQADLAKGRAALANSQTFRDSMRDAYEAAVQQAVTDGLITQAQADAILAESADMPFGPGAFRGFGGRHGFGGHGLKGGRDPLTQPTPTSELTPEGDA